VEPHKKSPAWSLLVRANPLLVYAEVAAPAFCVDSPHDIRSRASQAGFSFLAKELAGTVPEKMF